MKFTCPIKLIANPEGGCIAQEAQIPEARTFGEDKEAALHAARDAAHVALTACIEDGAAMPSPCSIAWTFRDHPARAGCDKAGPASGHAGQRTRPCALAGKLA